MVCDLFWSFFWCGAAPAHMDLGRMFLMVVAWGRAAPGSPKFDLDSLSGIWSETRRHRRRKASRAAILCLIDDISLGAATGSDAIGHAEPVAFGAAQARTPHSRPHRVFGGLGRCVRWQWGFPARWTGRRSRARPDVVGSVG